MNRSANTSMIDDPDIAAAVRFIRDHACEGIKVDHVLAVVPLHRRALERRFMKFLKRTPKEEITRVRIERIQKLLTETHLPLAEVATIAGFKHTEYLNVFFKKVTGQTPGRYRAQSQSK